MNNRRDFIRNMTLLTTGSLLVGNKKSAQAANYTTTQATAATKELGLQIYSLQRELYDDIPRPTSSIAGNMKGNRTGRPNKYWRTVKIMHRPYSNNSKSV